MGVGDPAPQCSVGFLGDRDGIGEAGLFVVRCGFSHDADDRERRDLFAEARQVLDLQA
jgi:hypothetical protein